VISSWRGSIQVAATDNFGQHLLAHINISSVTLDDGKELSIRTPLSRKRRNPAGVRL
jgi:hypothetical protein